MMQRKEEEILSARAEDLVKQADRGGCAVSGFLSPRELAYTESALRKSKAIFVSFGGYDQAERKRIYVFPSYMDGFFADKTSLDFQSILTCLQDLDYPRQISVIRVQGSGFVTLSHRDFMGALLGLGVERSVIGDIVLPDSDGREAFVFCDTPMVPFLMTEWNGVGRDKVKLTVLDPADLSIPPRRTAPIRDTVASARLDGIVSALCRISRDAAKTTVETGLVELDYESEERPDRTLHPPCLISVRGYGKFRVLSVCEQTKKGRFRLEAEKYL